MVGRVANCKFGQKKSPQRKGNLCFFDGRVSGRLRRDPCLPLIWRTVNLATAYVTLLPECPAAVAPQ